MTDRPTRSTADLDRLARLYRFGGWTLAGGLGATAMAGAGIYALNWPRGLVFARLAVALDDPRALPLIVVLVAGGLLTAIGLALYLGVPGLDPKLARRDFDAPLTILACLLAVFVLGNALSVPIVMLSDVPAGPRTGLPAPMLVMAMIATQASIMSILVWRVVRPGVLTWEDIGLTPRSLNRRILQGIVGGLAILFVAGLVGLVLRRVGIEQTQARMFEGIRGIGQAQLVAFWLTAAIVAPICEECFFRGYVFTALRGRYGRLAAYPASALLFAAIHFNLPALLPILVMALGLAFLYDRSGSVVPGIVAHGFNNSIALAALYAGVPT